MAAAESAGPVGHSQLFSLWLLSAGPVGRSQSLCKHHLLNIFKLLFLFIQSSTDIVIILNAEPEFHGVAKKSAKPYRCIRSDSTVALYNLRDARLRYTG